MTEVVKVQTMDKLNYWYRRSSISKVVLLQVKEKEPLLKKENLMVNALKRNCKVYEWVSAFG